MILIPQANIEEFKQKHPERWAAWEAVLQQHGTQTAAGWEVDWREYNAVSAARNTGVYDAVAHPAPVVPAAAPVQRRTTSSAVVDRRQGGGGCSGCGGVSATTLTGDPASINAVLTE